MRLKQTGVNKMNNQSTTKELHVIFGTGPLGKWTARHLTEMGKSVRLVNRSGKATNLPPTAELVTGDAYDAAQVQRLTEGAAAVYQCSQPDYTAWSGNFQRMQASLLAGAQAAGAKFIAAENIYMYGDTHGQPVTEKTPYNAHTKKGKVRQEMTESLMQAHEQGKVRVAMVRG
jgi:nucleoside-diphosphate-sugar epimerase